MDYVIKNLIDSFRFTPPLAEIANAYFIVKNLVTQPGYLHVSWKMIHAYSKLLSWFTELVYEEVINFQPKPTVIAEEVEKAQAAGKWVPVWLWLT